MSLCHKFHSFHFSVCYKWLAKLIANGVSLFEFITACSSVVDYRVLNPRRLLQMALENQRWVSTNQGGFTVVKVVSVMNPWPTLTYCLDEE